LTGPDQSAFSIPATKLHRTEQIAIRKKSCVTVKMLRISRATLSWNTSCATKLHVWYRS